MVSRAAVYHHRTDLGGGAGLQVAATQNWRSAMTHLTIEKMAVACARVILAAEPSEAKEIGL